jgi:hypothetical protein
MLVNNISARESRIREGLVAHLNETRSAGAVVRQEVPILCTRIDVLRIGRLLEGFEIKSDFDTLSRLPGQVDTYGKVMDEVTLVTGAELEGDAVHIVPKWWGVVRAVGRADGSVYLKTIRPPRRNPGQSANALAGMLWRTEAADALRSIANVSAPKRDTAGQLRARLVDAVPQEVIHRLVLSRLADESRLDKWQAARATVAPRRRALVYGD